MISDADVYTITQNVLGTMLDLDAAICGPDSQSTVDSQHMLTGCVLISGQWSGAVLVQASEQLGRLLAARFFNIAADQVDDRDIEDAMSELTNMIGGNVKGQVPAESNLSIPSVSVGASCVSQWAESAVISHVSVCCAGEPLMLTVCTSPQASSHCRQETI
jgi:chemotaxis protein CheX